MVYLNNSFQFFQKLWQKRKCSTFKKLYHKEEITTHSLFWNEIAYYRVLITFKSKMDMTFLHSISTNIAQNPTLRFLPQHSLIFFIQMNENQHLWLFKTETFDIILNSFFCHFFIFSYIQLVNSEGRKRKFNKYQDRNCRVRKQQYNTVLEIIKFETI